MDATWTVPRDAVSACGIQNVRHGTVVHLDGSAFRLRRISEGSPRRTPVDDTPFSRPIEESNLAMGVTSRFQRRRLTPDCRHLRLTRFWTCIIDWLIWPF